MTKGVFIRIENLRFNAVKELQFRRSRWNKFLFTDQRGRKPALYGVTGAINIHAILGLPLGSLSHRRQWAKSILGFRLRDGSFEGSDIPEHALCMAIQTLNIVGYKVPNVINQLAPLDINSFKDWVKHEDWQSTHKRLWGATAPLLAEGLASKLWIKEFTQLLTSKISLEGDFSFWCSLKDPLHKKISSLYHILQIYDAGSLPYPYPEAMIEHLLEMNWHKHRSAQNSTYCTDGDWAWILLQLCKVAPVYSKDAITQIRDVSRQRVCEWNEKALQFSDMSTHHMFCYLWVTALYQSTVREHFRGLTLHDTLNQASLFRLGCRS